MGRACIASRGKNECNNIVGAALYDTSLRVTATTSKFMRTNLAIFSFPVYYIYVAISVISAWFHKHARRDSCSKSHPGNATAWRNDYDVYDVT